MKILASHHRVALFLIALIGLLCYSNTFHVPFDFDDRFTIVLNEAVHLKNLSFQGLIDAALNQGNRPVSSLTFAFNYYFGGLNVLGYHLFNLAIHLASGMVFYLWIYKTLSLPFFQSQYASISKFRIAILASLLWITHPVQTQAVTYIVQRMTGLATLFYLLTLLTYLMGRTGSIKHRPIWFALSVGSALLALGSKEIAATLPVVILLYDAVFIYRLEPAKIRARLFFYSALLASLVLLGGIQLHTKGVGLFTEHYHQQTFSMLERLLTEGRVIVYYLSLLILPLPSRLTIEYYFPISHSLIDPVSTLFSWTLILSLVTSAIWNARRAPLVAFCILWFFVNLAIESSIIMLDLVYEHRLYLPSIGIFFLAAVGIENFINCHLRLLTPQHEHSPPTLPSPSSLPAARLPDGQGQAGGEGKGGGVRLHFLSSSGQLGGSVMRKYASIGIFTAILGFNSVWTWERNWVWNDRVALWVDAVSKYPENPRIHYNLGFAYMESNQLELAFKELKEAVSLRPEYQLKLIPTLNKNAIYFQKAGKIEDAQTILLGAIRISPDDALSRYNLGSFFLERGDFQSAAEHLKKAVQLNPNHSMTRNNLGMAYLNLGRFEEAVEQFKEAIRLNPKNVEAYNNLGVSYMQVGLLDQAIVAFNEALRFNPQYSEAHYNLGMLYEIKGQKSLANEHYLKGSHSGAVLLAPGSNPTSLSVIPP